MWGGGLGSLRISASRGESGKYSPAREHCHSWRANTFRPAATRRAHRPTATREATSSPESRAGRGLGALLRLRNGTRRGGCSAVSCALRLSLLASSRRFLGPGSKKGAWALGHTAPPVRQPWASHLSPIRNAAGKRFRARNARRRQPLWCYRSCLCGPAPQRGPRGDWPAPPPPPAFCHSVKQVI